MFYPTFITRFLKFRNGVGQIHPCMVIQIKIIREMNKKSNISRRAKQQRETFNLQRTQKSHMLWKNFNQQFGMLFPPPKSLARVGNQWHVLPMTGILPKVSINHHHGAMFAFPMFFKAQTRAGHKREPRTSVSGRYSSRRARGHSERCSESLTVFLLSV